MPSGLRRYHQAHCLHFITFSCYRRAAKLSSAKACNCFEIELERIRKWYGLFITGYVVMPTHVHLLVSEPERKSLAVAMQMLKQSTSRKLSKGQFWQIRGHDFLVRSEDKRVEKLRYMHRNPVRAGLVEKPEDWKWSSFNHYAMGAEGVVEIESEWTARKREQMGVVPLMKMRVDDSHPVDSKTGSTRVGQPREKKGAGAG